MASGPSAMQPSDHQHEDGDGDTQARLAGSLQSQEQEPPSQPAQRNRSPPPRPPRSLTMERTGSEALCKEAGEAGLPVDGASWTATVGPDLKPRYHFQRGMQKTTSNSLTSSKKLLESVTKLLNHATLDLLTPDKLESALQAVQGEPRLQPAAVVKLWGDCAGMLGRVGQQPARGSAAAAARAPSQRLSGEVAALVVDAMYAAVAFKWRLAEGAHLQHMSPDAERMVQWARRVIQTALPGALRGHSSTMAQMALARLTQTLDRLSALPALPTRLRETVPRQLLELIQWFRLPEARAVPMGLSDSAANSQQSGATAPRASDGTRKPTAAPSGTRRSSGSGPSAGTTTQPAGAPSSRNANGKRPGAPQQQQQQQRPGEGMSGAGTGRGSGGNMQPHGARILPQTIGVTNPVPRPPVSVSAAAPAGQGYSQGGLVHLPAAAGGDNPLPTWPQAADMPGAQLALPLPGMLPPAGRAAPAAVGGPTSVGPTQPSGVCPAIASGQETADEHSTGHVPQAQAQTDGPHGAGGRPQAHASCAGSLPAVGNTGTATSSGGQAVVDTASSPQPQVELGTAAGASSGSLISLAASDAMDTGMDARPGAEGSGTAGAPGLEVTSQQPIPGAQEEDAAVQVVVSGIAADDTVCSPSSAKRRRLGAGAGAGSSGAEVGGGAATAAAAPASEAVPAPDTSATQTDTSSGAIRAGSTAVAAEAGAATAVGAGVMAAATGAGDGTASAGAESSAGAGGGTAAIMEVAAAAAIAAAAAAIAAAAAGVGDAAAAAGVGDAAAGAGEEDVAAAAGAGDVAAEAAMAGDALVAADEAAPDPAAAVPAEAPPIDWRSVEPQPPRLKRRRYSGPLSILVQELEQDATDSRQRCVELEEENAGLRDALGSAERELVGMGVLRRDNRRLEQEVEAVKQAAARQQEGLEQRNAQLQRQVEELQREAEGHAQLKERYASLWGMWERVRSAAAEAAPPPM